MKRIFFLFMLLLVISLSAVASYVSFQPYTIKQPDGEAIECFVSGDEYFNWLHDAEGFTIIQAPDGYFYYGVVENGLVIPSQYKVNSINPEAAGLRKWAKVSLQEYERRRSLYSRDNNTSVNVPHSGTMNNLIIYLKFSDDTEFVTTRQTYDNLFNLPTGSSVKSYFSEVSYTQLNLNSTHYPACAMSTNLSYTDSHPRSYFEPYNATSNLNGYNGESERTIREHTLLRDAIDWININSPVPGGLNIDADNDLYVDNVVFVARGGNGAWASLLWPHQWSLFTYNVAINGKYVWNYTFQPESYMSVITTCHEMFHTLGSPDLYHYSSNGINPVSSWDLMENGSGHMGAYMKWKYSGNTWISSIPEITTSGTYTLNPLASSTNNCYKIAAPGSASQYYVIEYRRKTGTFEGNVPGSGLLVYRIDPDYTGNASGPPDEVYIYRPGGTVSVNGSPGSAHYSSESGRTAINDATNPSGFLQNGNPGGLNISNITSAGSTISFTVTLNAVSNPATFTATASGPTQVSLTWQKNAAGNNVMVVYNTSSSFGTPANGTSYSAGTTLAGGGTVLYNGSNVTFLHIGLNPSTVYYYKTWSVDASNTYSYGLTASATTQCTASALPLSQSFGGGVIPGCWFQQTDGATTLNSWTVSATANAGGSSGEMKSTWQYANPGTSRLVLPPINTTGMSQLSLNFRHMFDDFTSGVTLRIQSSSDGVNWTNEAWSLASVSNANVGPVRIYTNVVNNLNSASTYVAFTVEGNLYNYDYWYIDDVVVQNATTTTTILPNSPTITYGAGSVNLTATVSPNPGGGTINFYVDGTPAGTSAVIPATGTATLAYNPSGLSGGSHSIRADFGSYNNYKASSSHPSANGVLTVNKADQTITFGALATKTYGDASFSLTATASSFLSVSYSSSNTSVATVAGNSVTITGIGSTNITASQAGNSNYNAAADVVQSLVVNAQSLTWTGTTSADWATASNWNPNTVPSAGSNIIIPDVATNPVISQLPANPAICNNITLQSGAVLTVETGKALTVNGIFTNNAGSGGLLIKSGASVLEANGVNATVERTITANEWHFISSPVSNAVSGMLSGRYLQKFNEATYSYSDILSLTEDLNPLQGYALWGDASGFTASFAGSLNSGEKSISVSRNNALAYPKYSGWNLVGNPYPSYIDWSSATGWTKQNINATIYIHVNSATWATFNPVTGGLNGGSAIIAPFQGFFAEASAAGSLSINNNARTHSTTQFFKSPGDQISNLLRLEITGSGYKDETLVVFLPQASDGFDGEYDAHKLFGEVPESPKIFTLGKTELAINALPATEIVPLCVKAGTDGTFTIGASEINDIAEISLQDTKTGIFTDLLKKTYTFDYTPGEKEQRFLLHFGPLDTDELKVTDIGIYSYRKTIYVNFGEPQKGDIFIYNLAGQQMESRWQSSGTEEIVVIQPGIYIVKVITRGSIVVKKVYIQ